MSTLDEQRSVIGLRDLYIALVTQDDADAYAADTPQAFAPAVNASHKPKVNKKVQYADDRVFDTTLGKGETDFDLEVTNIPLEMQALVLGQTYDAATGRIFDNAGSTPPDVALGFRAQKSNGSYRYYWFLKGKFSPPDEEHSTKADTPEPKNLKIKFTATDTIYAFDLGDETDSARSVIGDEDISGFDADGWFDAVQVPVAGSPDAFTCTPDPLDGATGVAVSKTITLTFSNPLAGGAEVGILLTKDDGTVKACAKSINSARTAVTLDPSTNLSSATDYLVTLAGVVDVYGQELGDTVYNFTTA
jgi:phi13 family phage major tail protein